MCVVECLDQYVNCKKNVSSLPDLKKNSQQMTHSERKIAPKTHSQEAPCILSLLFFRIELICTSGLKS